MKVQILTHTPNPEKVIAQAAKLCYSAISVDELTEKLTDEKIEKFVTHLVNIGHESPFEHASFTFAIEGVSRVLSHQLVRHRIASPSQQSQRYVKLDQFDYIVPKSIQNCPGATTLFKMHMEESQRVYNDLVDMLMNEKIRLFKENHDRDMTKKEYNSMEKEAIEDARYVFPNACETKIVITMNARSLLNFFNLRCCNRAQLEIRELADEMLKQCKQVAPILFKNAGPDCICGKCGEGSMSCGKPRNKEELFK